MLFVYLIELLIDPLVSARHRPRDFAGSLRGDRSMYGYHLAKSELNNEDRFLSSLNQSNLMLMMAQNDSNAMVTRICLEQWLIPA